MKANEENMQNSAEVDNIHSENKGQKLDKRPKNHFGDSLVVLSSPGVTNIFAFRKSCHFHLQNINDIEDRDVKEFAEHIKTETERTNRTLYKIQFNLNTVCDGYSYTFMNLLSELRIPQLQSIMVGWYNF